MFTDSEFLAFLKVSKTMAEIDGCVSFEEIEVLQEIVKECNPAQKDLKTLLVEADGYDFWTAIGHIRDLEKEKKIYIVECIKKIIYADGIKDESEEKLFQLLKVICDL